MHKSIASPLEVLGSAVVLLHAEASLLLHQSRKPVHKCQQSFDALNETKRSLRRPNERLAQSGILSATSAHLCSSSSLCHLLLYPRQKKCRLAKLGIELSVPLRRLATLLIACSSSEPTTTSRRNATWRGTRDGPGAFYELHSIIEGHHCANLAFGRCARGYRADEAMRGASRQHRAELSRDWDELQPFKLAILTPSGPFRSSACRCRSHTTIRSPHHSTPRPRPSSQTSATSY